MPSLPDTETLIVFLAFVGGFASILTIALPFARRDPGAARLKAVAKRREELGQEQRQRLAQQRARRRPQAHVTLMRTVMERLKLMSGSSLQEVKHKLAAAGYRNQSAVVTFVFARFAAGGGGAVLAFIFATMQQRYDLSLLAQIFVAALVGAIGFAVPGVLVKNAAAKRQQEITKTFPDALDLLVICVESGLSIEGAFARVTEEIAANSPVLSQELGLTSAELAFLGDRQKAYHNLADRTGLPAVKALAMALAQSDRYGTPVGVALKIQAQESRDDRMAKAEKKAGALPAQLTVPMILFFLPVLFMVIIGPAIIQMVAL